MEMIKKVIVVEDEEMIRKGLRYTFDWDTANCVVIDEAENGVEGLEKVLVQRPDIIVTDVTMPLMDGITMLRKASQEYYFASIILSGYDDFDYAKSAIDLGVIAYLLKPLDYRDLNQALSKANEAIEIHNRVQMIKETIDTYGSEDIYKFDLISKEDIDNNYVRYLLQYIEQNYHKKISINDVVENLNKSVSYLQQKFKQFTSYTFNDYLNRYRVKESIRLMRKGDEKIYTIARDVGFSNYRYFITVFKKYTGRLPTDFITFFREQEEL